MEFVGKCLFIKEKGKKILVVGDLHLGFEESLNEGGVFVSRKMFEEMIEYLDGVFERVGKVDYVVLLGDVKHDFGRISRQEWNDVLGLLDYLENKCRNIIIVKGNHDIILERIVNKRKEVKLVDYFVVGKYCFLHGHKDFDEIRDVNIKYWIMGHIHPAVNLSDGIKVEKYKCFLVGKFKGRGVVIVPCFLSYKEGSDLISVEKEMKWSFNFDKFNVKIVGIGLEVLDFGLLGRLR
jgi:uncharacterized protein